MATVDSERWQRRLEREKRARKQAEALLEQKSLELYQANQELQGAVSALEASSSRLAAILDHTFAGILVVDEQGGMITVNRAARAMFGRAETEAVGARPADLMAPGSRAVCESAEASRIETAAAGPTEVWHQVEGRRPDGATFPLEFVITRLDVGEQQHQIWILRDLTRQRAAEAAQHALEQDLRQAQKLEALGTMAGGVAHEINTPVQYVGDNVAFLGTAFDDLLAVLRAYRELRDGAGQGGDLSRMIARVTAAEDAADLEGLILDVPEAVTQAREGIARVSRIVQAIKQFARPGGAKPRPICRAQWTLVAEVETDYTAGLPPVIGDRSEFNQVILNLIVNAAQAIEQRQGGIAGRITLRTGVADGDVVITVGDNGCGIPEPLFERIFEPFFTTREVGKGAGQGLAICYKFVNGSLGGSITVASTEGAGSTFTLRLPAMAREEAQIEPPVETA